MTSVSPPEHRAYEPILVLGGHRTGAGIVMGLLATAGELEVGEVMPQAATKTRGTFESAAIVRCHNVLFRSLDRDWTCPPVSIDPATTSVPEVAAEIRRLQATARPWGVKEPRLLFTLPIWAQLVPALRLVGVVRDHEEVVRSLQDGQSVDPGMADAIARAYARRLARLRERFEFPIVDVSNRPETVLEQTKAAAKALGLSWNGEAAYEYFEPKAIQRRSKGLIDNPDVDYLRTCAESDTTAAPISTEELRSVLDEFSKDPDDLTRYCGPRANARRALVWKGVSRDASRPLELTRNLRVFGSIDPLDARAGRAVECSDLTTMFEELRSVPQRSDAIVLPDLTSWLRRDELTTALALLHDHVEVDGTVVIGVSRADAETQQRLGREPISANELRSAAVDAGFAELPASSEADIVVLRFVAMASVTTLLRSLVDAQVVPRQPRTEAKRKAPASQVSSTPPKSSDADTWQREYERLRNRRSVRFSLAIASTTRPIFRLLRSIRARRPHS